MPDIEKIGNRKTEELEALAAYGFFTKIVDDVKFAIFEEKGGYNYYPLYSFKGRENIGRIRNKSFHTLIHGAQIDIQNWSWTCNAEKLIEGVDNELAALIKYCKNLEDQPKIRYALVGILAVKYGVTSEPYNGGHVWKNERGTPLWIDK